MQANADDADFKIRFIRVWHIRVIRVPIRFSADKIFSCQKSSKCYENN